MDGSTPAKLFADTTNVKVIKPDLEIYISVGGWLVNFSSGHRLLASNSKIYL
jgi:GH18 family chitinase